MDDQEVACYGLHWDGPIAWLVQGRGGSNFVGLKKTNPFKAPRFSCNHLIPTAAPIPDRVHWESFLRLQDCQVLQRMLPIPQSPQNRIAFVESVPDEVLWFTTVSRLSSPIRPIIRPAWTIKIKDLDRELCSSNIQPLVVTGLNQTHQPLISALADLSVTHARTVILSGDDSVVLRPNITRLSMLNPPMSLEDLMLLPLENIGAAVLRRFARKEDIFAPMESRDDRRSRLIKERNGASRLPDR